MAPEESTEKNNYFVQEQGLRSEKSAAYLGYVSIFLRRKRSYWAKEGVFSEVSRRVFSANGTKMWYRRTKRTLKTLKETPLDLVEEIIATSKIRIFFNGKAREKITADMMLIFRGLFFECNAASPSVAKRRFFRGSIQVLQVKQRPIKGLTGDCCMNTPGL